MITLHNNIQMPSIGLGTWLIEPRSFDESISTALENGYRLFDSATAYESELELGQAISHAPRDEVWLTSKVWNNSHGYYQTLEAFEQTLEQLGTDYLDTYMIHWPCPQQGLWQDTWQALEFLHSRGHAKTIGVSNFNAEQLQQLLAMSSTVPHIVQAELHPLWQQQELRQLCNTHGIHLQASRPLAHGKLLESTEYIKLAQELNVDPAWLAIQWTLSKGCSLVPRSSNKERQALNALAASTSTSSTLHSEQLALVDALGQTVQLQTGDDPETMHRGCKR